MLEAHIIYEDFSIHNMHKHSSFFFKKNKNKNSQPLVHNLDPNKQYEGKQMENLSKSIIQ
jgi:hypothetical protein